MNNTVNIKSPKVARNENPFYGLQALFALEQAKGNNITTQMLDNAWREVKSKGREAIELFHVIAFSTGDIANRQHNFFGQEPIEKGGMGKNANWQLYLKWLLKNDRKQLIAFLPLIVEYVNLRDLVTCQVKTEKGKKIVKGQDGLLQDIQTNKAVYAALLDFLCDLWNSKNPMSRQIVAKFVKTPDYSRVKTDKNGEKSTRPLQSVTKLKMQSLEKLCVDFSKRMGWAVKEYPHNKNFTGFINARKEYNGEAEYVLFSNGKIRDFDKEQFLTWVEKLPSGARYQTRRRLLDGDDKTKGKWITTRGEDLADLFLAFEKRKEGAQQALRNLEEKARTVGLDNNEKEHLVKVQRAAKVTTGGKTLFDYLNDFLNGKVDNITIQSIVDKMVFDVPVLPIVDCSGSMGGKPLQMAQLLTTLLLYKNQTNENLFFKFGSDAIAVCDGVATEVKQKRLMVGKTQRVEKIVDKTKTLFENYNVVKQLVNSDMGGTTFSSVASVLKKWVDSDVDYRAARVEQILKYPVMLVVTDGDFNNDRTQAESLAHFQRDMLQWFGWNGIVCVWDIPKYGDGDKKSGYYDKLPNVIHFTTWNLSTINTIFTKIDDMDIIDVYTSLKSLYASNRYAKVREAVIAQ